MLEHKTSGLQVGMRLLEVNGVSLLGASHQEAVNVLRNSGHEITLVVCKGKRIEMLVRY
jgi:protein scribble